jgi:hypothetical protein
VFTATARGLSTDAPSASAFTVRDTAGALNEGFNDELPGTHPTEAGLPASSGLRLIRYGHFARRPFDERVAGYASGLAWATVARVRNWHQDRLFGVGDFAERVMLPGGGVGYYEPATAMEPRRIALHSKDSEYLVSTNLPRRDLLRLAGSLSATGTDAPASWLVRRWSGGVVRDGLSVREAVARVRFGVLVPQFVPEGYREAAAEVVDTPRIHGVTLVYRRPAAELDGVGLRLYEAVGETLPPPQSVSEEAVRLRGTVGRWSAESHLLEWVENGTYRSLSSPAFDLSTLLRVAESMRFAEHG